MNDARFKAYGYEGHCVLIVDTRGSATDVERAAFQERLDRGELAHVDVHYNDPYCEDERLRARKA